MPSSAAYKLRRCSHRLAAAPLPRPKPCHAAADHAGYSHRVDRCGLLRQHSAHSGMHGTPERSQLAQRPCYGPSPLASHRAPTGVADSASALLRMISAPSSHRTLPIRGPAVLALHLGDDAACVPSRHFLYRPVPARPPVRPSVGRWVGGNSVQQALQPSGVLEPVCASALLAQRCSSATTSLGGCCACCCTPCQQPFAIC